VLIEHGADLGDKVVKNDGYHPLLFASLMGQRQLVQLLLRARPKGALQPDNQGLTPLMAASRNGHTATVRLLLLARGMRDSIDVADKAGTTALMYAVRGSHAAAAKVLVNAGANVRLTDANGMTPLQVATNNNDGMCMRLLGSSED
jgi:ankyrin repeat protein